MRQLKTENRMHNRVRMVVASFLCKDLLSDRRYGEEHFAQYLLDYDMNVNIGNRQWAASVGADPKPLRIFNPSLQSQRFDPEAAYIRKRIPELKNIPLEHIHNPEKYSLPYASPLVLHKEYSQYAKRMYAKQPLDITHTLFP
jgi:deoxyribodipyrimidine photo-lyase